MTQEDEHITKCFGVAWKPAFLIMCKNIIYPIIGTYIVILFTLMFVYT